MWTCTKWLWNRLKCMCLVAAQTWLSEAWMELSMAVLVIHGTFLCVGEAIASPSPGRSAEVGCWWKLYTGQTMGSIRMNTVKIWGVQKFMVLLRYIFFHRAGDMWSTMMALLTWHMQTVTGILVLSIPLHTAANWVPSGPWSGAILFLLLHFVAIGSKLYS